MTSDSVAEVLVWSKLLPVYWAVMVCVPTASELVLKVATPPELRVPVPSVVPPSLKVTLPVGVGPVAAVTVAVKVTDVPCVAGLAEEPSAVEVEALLTVWVSVPDVLVRKLLSPL